MRKIISICMAVAMLLILSVSVSAETLSWNNYVYTYDSEEVGCIIPAEQSTAVYFNGSSKVAEFTAASSEYLYTAGSLPRIQVWPMGSGNYMTLENIPVDTPMTWSVSYKTDGSAVTGSLHGNFITYLVYYAEDFSQISSTIIDSGEQTLPHQIDVTVTLQYPNNAKYFRVWTYLQGWDTYSSGVLISLDCSPVAMLLGIKNYSPPGGSIMPGLILGGLAGQTTINPEIAERFQAIQDSDRVLLEQWSRYTGSYVTYTRSASQILRARTNSFLAIRSYLELLLKIPFFEEILLISMTLGIAGFVLGLVSYAAQKGVSDGSSKHGSTKRMG